MPFGTTQLVTEADMWKPLEHSGCKEDPKQEEKIEPAEANRAALMEADRQCC